jgi:hypothetical protein
MYKGAKSHIEQLSKSSLWRFNPVSIRRSPNPKPYPEQLGFHKAIYRRRWTGDRRAWNYFGL